MSSGWAPKRFWTTVGVTEEPGGYGIALDARKLRTPAKAPLVVPGRALAEAIAAEWQAQEEKVDPATMPVTRTANSVIDKVRPQHDAVAEMLAEYGATDLLCYRADGPDELAARQRAGWDPILDWLEAETGARLVTTEGIVPVTQPGPALARLAKRVATLDDWRLAAFHDFVTLSGSLALALALAGGRLTAAEAWPLSRIDEDWQAEQWGADEEAVAHAERRRAALAEAERFWELLDRP